jgi:hypothetical protein
MSKVDDPVGEILGLLADRAVAVRDRLSDLRTDLSREMELRPFRTLALSAGAGFLLAGGLFSRATLRLISFGARLAILPVIASDIAAMREASAGAGDLAGDLGLSPRRVRSRHKLPGSQT